MIPTQLVDHPLIIYWRCPKVFVPFKCPTRIFLSSNLNQPIGERHAFPLDNKIRIKLLPGNDPVTSSWTLGQLYMELKRKACDRLKIHHLQQLPVLPQQGMIKLLFSPGAAAKNKTVPLLLTRVYA